MENAFNMRSDGRRQIPWEHLNDLHSRAHELKLKRDFVGMLPIREEIARVLEEARAGAKQVGNALNYLGALNLQLKRYAVAETYARRSISYFQEHGGQDHEVLATYIQLLAWILAFDGRFADAIPLAEKAIIEYSVFHSPEDDFLTRRKAELEDLRIGKVSIQFEFC